MHLSENWARISPAMDNHRNDDINAACDRLEQRERAAQAADMNGSIEKQTTNEEIIPE